MSEQTEINFVNKCCGKCGGTAISLTEIDGQILCKICLESNYYKCHNCKKVKRISDRCPVRDSNFRGKLVCSDCYKEYFIVCNHCGYGHKKSEMCEYNGGLCCRRCYESMFVCIGCNQRKWRELYFDGGLCNVCYEEERNIINPNHEAKAPLEFRGKGPHFFGIELEVVVDEKLERRTCYAKKVLKLFDGFVITKHDGSITDLDGRVNGFEIVTIPASRDVHVEKWNKFFDNLPKGMRSYDTRTCGLHIHCSRKPLSQLTIAKMLLFINSKENFPFIEVIAGRGPNRFCKIQNKVPGDWRRARDRYEALNLTNRGTVEFRIFRGTLKRESLFKSLEFCDALIHFCKECSCSISDSKRVDKFLDYVKLHKKEYIHLWAFLTARWFKIENDLTKKMGFPLPGNPTESESYKNEPNPELVNNTDADNWINDYNFPDENLDE